MRILIQPSLGQTAPSLAREILAKVVDKHNIISDISVETIYYTNSSYGVIVRSESEVIMRFLNSLYEKRIISQS